MYKKIIEGEILSVTGQNIYASADTAVYFNSISAASQVEILRSSFSEENNGVQVTIPCCLPDVNTLIVYNGVSYVTGENPYLFVGAPIINEVSPSRQLWKQTSLIKGNHLEDITGFYVGDTEVTDYDWPTKEKVAFRVPIDSTSGYLKIQTEVGEVTSADVFEPVRLPIYAAFKTENQINYYGDKIELIGDSLDLVNRVALSGVAGNVYVENISGIGSTGLNFSLPQGVVNDSPITVQNQSGYYQNGEFISNIIEEKTLADSLRINSVYLYTLNETVGVYGDPILINGINLNKSKIFFKGYNNAYIESPIVSSGNYNVTVNTPKNIRYEKILASGYGEGLGQSKSLEYFYPLPTIENISTLSWQMGELIQIDAINASEIRPVIGISGYNLLTVGDGIFFVSNTDDTAAGYDYFGTMVSDNSSMVADSSVGHTRITALINSVVAGTGVPFLVSTYEDGESIEARNNIKANALSGALMNSNTYKRIHDLKGASVRISGKKPNIQGSSNPRAAAEGIIDLSGNYFLGTTGLALYNSSELKTISSDQYISAFPGKILLTETGVGLNHYDKVHTIRINLSDFNFESTQGNFKILAPYYNNI